MQIKIHPNAAHNYFARRNAGRPHRLDFAGCHAWDAGGPYHDRFRLARLERMQGQWFDVQEEYPDHVVTEPIDGISDVGELIDKVDVCETR